MKFVAWLSLWQDKGLAPPDEMLQQQVHQPRIVHHKQDPGQHPGAGRRLEAGNGPRPLLILQATPAYALRFLIS